MALGAADLLPIEMAGAYAAIANQGTYVQPYLVGRIVSPDGQVLEQAVPRHPHRHQPPGRYVLTHMMEGVVQHGTGYELHTLDLDVAGKTGTTDDFSDAWFSSASPRATPSSPGSATTSRSRSARG